MEHLYKQLFILPAFYVVSTVVTGEAHMSENTSGSEESASWSVAVAAVAALAASVCCVLPLVLVGLGVTGTWVASLSALAPLKPYFIGGSLLLLGYAGYREYKMAIQPDCACDTVLSSKTRRAVLGVATLLILGLLGSTLLVSSPATTTAAANQGEAVGQTAALKEVVLEVEGMTCSGCTAAVRSSLQQLEGVQEVKVTYEPPQAVVTYDPAKVTSGQLAQAPTDVGYPAQIK